MDQILNTGVIIVVTGVVQGVGFRWFVERAANNLEVSGCVRNRFDGSVEIKAEGGKNVLEALIKEIRIGPRSASVRGITVDWVPYEGKYKSFEITF